MHDNVSLLENAYKLLDFEQGELFSIDESPHENIKWLDIGEWLESCKKINLKNQNYNIDKMFFIENNPAIIFGNCTDCNKNTIHQAFINTWCMARPKYLFLSVPGELRIYDLTRAATIVGNTVLIPEPVEIVKTAIEISKKLQRFSRANIESGILETDEDRKSQRADKTLINDIKKIRHSLIDLGLSGSKLKYAHTIIGRSIFIRYLEDRKILTKEYFLNIAQQNADWQKALDIPVENIVLQPEKDEICYIKILHNKDFTYALFSKLSSDFNGDMFPIDSIEKDVITDEHLIMISNFLQGKFDEQLRLFFWAYKFDVIPMELISSLYEEFYHNEIDDNNGTHYTPLSLVEFVLSQTLTSIELENNPRVLDLCCGSGIFIVEAFKRIVRFNIIKNKGKRLSNKQLREILKNQILGIEITDEALRIAAFSLYVALLDFQDPPNILAQLKNGKYLPSLKANMQKCNDSQYFNILICNDTFLINSDKDEYKNMFLQEKSVDIIIGNPPWGKAGKNAIDWCKIANKKIGNIEYSQAFIWRALSIIKNDGKIGFLLPTGVFSKHNNSSKLFRKEWLSLITLLKIVNFMHVRDIFFDGSGRTKGAIAPFISVVFRNTKPTQTTYFPYWSLKHSSDNIKQQYIVLSKLDMHYISQESLIFNNDLWKIYWWGSYADNTLINKLKSYSTLKLFCEERKCLMGQGYTPGKLVPSGDLFGKREIEIKGIKSYGRINKYLTKTVPSHMHRRFSTLDLFCGDRLLVKRGISKNGIIVSRLEREEFCFRTSMNCLRFYNTQNWEQKNIHAILMSSVARYYFFLTSSSWGTWHYEIHKQELENLPLSFAKKECDKQRISDIIDKISNYEDVTLISGIDISSENVSLDKLYKELDRVIFDIYQLTEHEINLINDMCSMGLDFFYNKNKSIAVKPLKMIKMMQYGDLETLLFKKDKHSIYNYLTVFIEIWNKELEQINADLEWRVFMTNSLIAVEFLTKYKDNPIIDYRNAANVDELNIALDELNQHIKQAITSNIFVDGIVTAISENSIVIIKRNEARNWTKSVAYQDASSMIVNVIDKSRLNGDK